MKRSIFTLIIVAITITSYGQKPATKKGTEPILSQTNNSPIYQLFPTQNMWTFIKLNTRDGKMWQVQFDVNGDNRKEEIINSSPLILMGTEVNGRFKLYPTENIYNFLLLDQIEGYVYQVQWSFDPKKRGVIPIE